MSNIIPFVPGQLPAHLANRQSAMNQALANLATASFPVMSIKGKSWTLVRSGERKVLRNPKDPDSPASSIGVVIVNSAPGVSRVYYKEEYEDGSVEKPDCFSNDGVSPDPASTDPQANKCQLCPHSKFGSGRGGKGPRCANSCRLAIAAPDKLDDPILLRVPGASLANLSTYAKSLGAVPVDSVVTKIGFDTTEAHPKLVFEPVGYVTPEMTEEIEATAVSDTVSQIIAVSPAAGVTEQAAAATEKTAEAEKPQPKKSSKKTAAKTEKAPEPEPEPEPEPAPEQETGVSGSLAADIDALLSEYED